VTNALEKTVDQGVAVRYVQKQAQKGFLINIRTVLPLSGLVGELLRSHLPQVHTAETGFRGKHPRIGKTPS
jgi:hypothetical protein